MTAGRRPAWRRIGLSALNVVAPGVGLLGVGRWRVGILLVAAILLLMAARAAIFAAVPRLSFPGYATVTGLMLAAFAAAILVSAVFTWRWSRTWNDRRPIHSRWHVLIAVGLAFGQAVSTLDELALRFYKPFYLPAQSMAPTIAKNDRIVASMSGALPLRRGDVVLFDTRRRVFIKRVAGLPGDRVAMVRGLVVLNGRAIPQLSIRTEWTQGIDGGVQAKRLSEQFPGEERAHHVYDLGESPLDDMPEQEVRQGHVFLLGDNRDLSADSRVPKAMDGVEQVPLGNVRGRALFFGFGRLEKMGRPID